MERRYLLSVRELMDAGEDSIIWHEAAKRLDGDRLSKLDRLKVAPKRAACIGAGLILQWAYLEWLEDNEKGKQSSDLNDIELLENGVSVSRINLYEIIRKIKTPYNFEIQYNHQGKPYIKEHVFFYNISHSGEYIFCGVSGNEIGVDIQKQESVVKKHGKDAELSVAARFFSEDENAMIESLPCECQNNMFYKLWVRKEALGKCIGDGIVAHVKESVLNVGCEADSIYIWEEYEIPNEYSMAVCRLKGKLQTGKVSIR